MVNLWDFIICIFYEKKDNFRPGMTWIIYPKKKKKMKEEKIMGAMKQNFENNGIFSDEK